MSAGPLLVYGGTFDPVHRGHVALAESVLCVFEGAELRLVPCADPPHRDPPEASAADRAVMLRIAFAGMAPAVVDERELGRKGPSYSVDTLAELREECGPERSLILVLGVDAANGLDSWHRCAELSQLANLLVVERPGCALDADVAGLGWRWADRADALAAGPAGWVFRHRVTVSDASSTAVRAALRAGECSPASLHHGVARYIVQHRLYA